MRFSREVVLDDTNLIPELITFAIRMTAPRTHSQYDLEEEKKRERKNSKNGEVKKKMKK